MRRDLNVSIGTRLRRMRETAVKLQQEYQSDYTSYGEVELQTRGPYPCAHGVCFAFSGLHGFR